MSSNRSLDGFQAISDPSRRAILKMLSDKSQHINAIAENFNMSRPAISKHIKILTEAGFIIIKEQGRQRLCELSPTGFDEIKEWMEYFEAHWRKQLQNLDTYLKNKRDSDGLNQK